MYKKLTFSLSCLVLLLIMSIKSNITTDRCFQYKECWTCIGDPCSSRKKAEIDNNICLWCNNYPDVGPACISTLRDGLCLPEPIKYLDQCMTRPKTSVPTEEPSLTPFITKDYIVHLEYLRNDIFGIIQAEVGVQNFNVWIAIDRVVNTKSVVEKCGSYTPISAIEMDDILPSLPPFVRRDRCWNLGEITSVSPVLSDISNLQEGIVLDFGTSPCCSGLSNTTYINTTVLLNEGYCSYDSVKSSLSEGNIAMLRNCLVNNVSLQFVVQTSVLCRNHLEWRLSVEETTAFCIKKMSKEYRCTIELKAAVKEAVIASSFPYCQNNFILLKTFPNGSEENASSYQLQYRKGIQDSCSFVVDPHDICTLSIIYRYGNYPPQRIPINGTASLQLSICDILDKQSHKIWITVVSGLITICIAIFLLIAVFKSRRCIRKGYTPFSNTCKAGSTSDLSATTTNTDNYSGNDLRQGLKDNDTNEDINAEIN